MRKPFKKFENGGWKFHVAGNIGHVYIEKQKYSKAPLFSFGFIRLKLGRNLLNFSYDSFHNGRGLSIEIYNFLCFRWAIYGVFDWFTNKKVYFRVLKKTLIYR